MRVELHEAHRQTQRVGIVFAVARPARFLELGRPGCERQAVLEAGADIPEVGQRRSVGRNRAAVAVRVRAAAAPPCRRLPRRRGGRGLRGGRRRGAAGAAPPCACGAPCPCWPCPLPRSPARVAARAWPPPRPFTQSPDRSGLPSGCTRRGRVQIDRAVRILGLRFGRVRCPLSGDRWREDGDNSYQTSCESHVFMSASGVGRDRAIDGRRSEARNLRPRCPLCPLW